MSDKIKFTPDGLEIVNDAGKRVVIRTNHGATSDQYIDLPATGGTISTGGGDTDEKTKVSANDTTANYLESKLVAGSNVTLTTNNDGGNETITIAAAADNDEKAKVSSNDTTSGYLNGKLVAGANITLTENNNGGNETLTIAAAAAPVTSVNTKTGAVTLTNTDVGAAATSHTHGAGDIISGTIATARLGSGTANGTTFLAGDQSYKTPPYPVTSVNTQTGAVTLTNTDVGAAATSHTHAASDITSGTIATVRLGSGTADSTTFLRGDNTWAVPSGGGGGGSSDTNVAVTLTDRTATGNGGVFLSCNIAGGSVVEGDMLVVDFGFAYVNNGFNLNDCIITRIDAFQAVIAKFPAPTSPSLPTFHQIRQTLVFARDTPGAGNYIGWVSALGNSTSNDPVVNNVYQPISHVGLNNTSYRPNLRNASTMLVNWNTGFTYSLQVYFDNTMASSYLYPAYAKAYIRKGGTTL